jgi:hypothetical protein
MRQLTPFVSAQIAPRRMELTRDDGSTFIPAVTDGKTFITAWKHDKPDEYNELKEEWRVYLEAIGEIPARNNLTQIEEPIETPIETLMETPIETAVETWVKDPAHIQGVENAMAPPEDESSKPKSLLEKIFKT